MSDAILVAMITSAVTLFGVILSNSKTAAVTNNEIKHLTEEVKKHNNFAGRRISMALYSSGSSPAGKWMSTTGPITRFTIAFSIPINPPYRLPCEGELSGQRPD